MRQFADGLRCTGPTARDDLRCAPMSDTPLTIPDPRSFPAADSAPPVSRALYALAETSLSAATAQRADAIDRDLCAAFATMLAGEGAALASLFAGAPSVAVARHLWRALDATWRELPSANGPDLALTVFAMPLVIVTGREGAGAAEVALPGVLGDPRRLVAILGEFGALGGCRTVGVANVLVGSDAIDIARLPELAAWRRLPDSQAPDRTFPPRVLAPLPLVVHSGREAVHLRFLVGTAVAKSGVDLLSDKEVGKWGIPFAHELATQLATGGASVLALPRAPQPPLPAVAAGRVAQREVAAQIFASNAIRKFRASVGEPSAVISAHRAPDAPGGGELRLSLSSPFDPRTAEGFRAPLYALDRVGDVATMLVDLMRDCHVTDVRLIPFVHADRAPETGLPLLFKPDTIPDTAQDPLH
jgi:hypothetical protein